MSTVTPGGPEIRKMLSRHNVFMTTQFTHAYEDVHLKFISDLPMTPSPILMHICNVALNNRTLHDKYLF